MSSETTCQSILRSALIIGVGTSAGAILRILRVLCLSFPDLRTLGVLHIDTDGNMSFAHLPTPLVGTMDGWRANTFVHIPPPSEDLVRSIERGERMGYDHVPPAAFEAVKGDGMGSGGLVPMGNIAAHINRPRVAGAVRQAISRITAHSSELHDQTDMPLPVFEITGSLGGTWGAIEVVRDIIVSEARQMGTRVTFQRTVLFPGQHPTKDMEGSMASAAAWMQEFSARASGRHLSLQQGSSGKAPTIEVAPVTPTWIVSDMNAAPGNSATLSSPSALFTLVAWWHSLLLTSPLARRLEQTLVDFSNDALEEDSLGLRRVGRSYGISCVTLNRDRIELFSALRLLIRSIEELLAPFDKDSVERALKAFNRTQGLHEGGGHAELSTAIRSCSSKDRPTVDQAARVRNLLDESLAGLEGRALLRDARRIIDAVVAQTADVADHFRTIRENKVADVKRAVDEQLQQWVWGEGCGAPYAKACLSAQQRLFRRMIDLAAKDRRRHQEVIERLQKTVTQMEDKTIPRFLESGAVRRFIDQGEERKSAVLYARTLCALVVARIEDLARAEALIALQAIVETFAARHAAITALMEELARAADAAAAEVERVRCWDGTLHNPNGFALDDDLEACYHQVLRRVGDQDVAGDDLEQRAASDLLLRLRQNSGLLALEPESVTHEIAAIARQQVAAQVKGLHVQDELFRQYASGSELLEAFLKERDRESHERVTFQGTTEHDNPVHVLRFCVADSRRGTELTGALNAAAYTRGQAQGGAQYELLPMADAERITLVTVRLSFPPSDIGLHPPCTAAYDDAATTLPFERNHTELVGRFVPRPGQLATLLDAQIAMVKAYALSEETMHGRPAPLELESENGSRALVLNRWNGEREVVHADLGSEHHVGRRYNVRVELATRFYVTWRLWGPDILRQRMMALKGLQGDDSFTGGALTAAAVPLVSSDAIEAVVRELDWYRRNTNPKACLWWKNGKEEQPGGGQGGLRAQRKVDGRLWAI